MVKPLLSVTPYNRMSETMRTLTSLARTGTMEQAEVVIWDNASADGTAEMLTCLVQAGALRDATVLLHHENVGCPRALNMILQEFRKPGQDFIKVDNDVEILTPDWVIHLAAFLIEHPEVGICGPWYSEIETANQGRTIAEHDGWIEIFPYIGHCVMHRADILDRTGYFDLLAPDHLYGFEDLLMCDRSGRLGYKCAVVRGVEVKMIQRHSSLDVGKEYGTNEESQREHIDRLRPEYGRRKGIIWTREPGGYVVDHNGAITK